MIGSRCDTNRDRRWVAVGPADIAEVVSEFSPERRDFVRNLYGWLNTESHTQPNIALNAFVVAHYVPAMTRAEILIDHVFDGGGEGQFDALAIDHEHRRVTAVQGKARETLEKEKHSDIQRFVEEVAVLGWTETDDRFTNYLKAIPSSKLRSRIREARAAVESGFALNLVFATLADVDKQGLSRALKQSVEHAKLPDTTRTVVLDRDHLDSLLGTALDFLDEGVPMVQLQLDEEPVTDVYSGGYSMLVTTLAAAELVKAYKEHADRLFSANVRNYQGRRKGPIRDMIDQIRTHPEMFHLLNNGVTIVCSQIDGPKAHPDHYTVDLYNPQIVNGQQTTRTLVAADENPEFNIPAQSLSRTRVLVKILPENPKLLDDMGMDGKEFAHLVAVASNNQVAVQADDLRSNEKVLVQLEQDLRDIQVYLARKSGSAQEINRRSDAVAAILGVPRVDKVRSRQLASAVAALDPALRHFSGKYGPLRLFDSGEYVDEAQTMTLFDQIFDRKRPASEYYSMFTLHDRCQKSIGTGKEFGDMRSVTASILWSAMDLSTSGIETLAVLMRKVRVRNHLTPAEEIAVTALDTAILYVSEACTTYRKTADKNAKTDADFYKGFVGWNGLNEHLSESGIRDVIEGHGDQLRQQLKVSAQQP